MNLAVDRDVAAMHSRMSRAALHAPAQGHAQTRIAERSAKRRQFGHIQALYDVGPAPATYLLKRGQFETPGPEVEPGFLSVLCDADREAVASQPHSNGPDSGLDSGAGRLRPLAHATRIRVPPASWPA